MRAVRLSTGASIVQRVAPLVVMPFVMRLLPTDFRSWTFWHVQGMIAFITVLHYGLEAMITTRHYSEFQYIAPPLYVLPIIYSSLRFGRKGGLRTTLWCGVLLLPDISFSDRVMLQWLVDLVQFLVSAAVALAVSRLVERQRRLLENYRCQTERIKAVNDELVQVSVHAQNEAQRAREMSARLSFLNQKVMYAQEEERQRISRELHDETAQSLVLFCRDLDAVSATPRLPKDARARLQEMRTGAEECLEGVRRFCRDLRPPILDDLGLAPAVEWLGTELTRRHGIAVSVEVTGTQRRLAPGVELCFFRIAQEALRNVEKHAGASRAEVELAFLDRSVQLRVRDDGKGFEKPTSSGLLASGKLGLMGMEERANAIDGSLGVYTEPGRGTCITLVVRG